MPGLWCPQMRACVEKVEMLILTMYEHCDQHRQKPCLYPQIRYKHYHSGTERWEPCLWIVVRI